MSRLPFELFLACRYLRPKRTFVSVITLISIVGVMLGVAVLIIVISVMSGFDRELRVKLLGFNAHLKVLAPDFHMTNYAALMREVAANPEVQGVAPFIWTQVFLKTEPEDNRPSLPGVPFVRGVDPQREGQISILPASVKEGRFDVSGNGVLVGSVFAENLHLRVGDRVAITTPDQFYRMMEGHEKGKDIAILPDDYEIRGIVDVGYYEYNAMLLVASLDNARLFMGTDDCVQGLQVKLRDPDRAEQVREQLLAALGSSARIRTWGEENSDLLNALLVEKNVMFYILFFIMIVAAFGIASALITFVVQKTREIGMLKALGATSRQVMGLFLGQSLAVGVLGVISGLGLGMLAVAYRNEFLHGMNRLTGFELFPAKIYFFSELPAMIVPADIAIICGGSLLICLCAGVIPAWNAGRLKPVEALRYE
jgi:lipoprotein-releasing system permease protein